MTDRIVTDVLHQRIDDLSSLVRQQGNRLAGIEARVIGEQGDARIKDLEHTVTDLRRKIFKLQQLTSETADRVTLLEGVAYPVKITPIEEDETMLRVVRKNGARFKIKAKHLPQIVLYNGDRVETV